MNPASLLLETLRLDEGADPASLYSAWLHVETNGLARLVEFEGCALWLRQRLAQLNARDFADRRFRTWLDHRSRELVSRNLLVDAQIDRAARALSDGNVPFVLIRGSAWRALADTIPRADARATSDVEILIPAARARDAWGRDARGGLRARAEYDRAAARHAVGTLSPPVGLEPVACCRRAAYVHVGRRVSRRSVASRERRR